MQNTIARLLVLSASLVLFLASDLAAGTAYYDNIHSATTNPGSRDRRYDVYVGTGCGGDKACPMVVVLHGCSQDEDIIRVGTRYNDIADANGLIAVYPFVTSWPWLEFRNENCWGYWYAQHKKRDEGEPGDIYGIIREVVERFNVDENRIHITGISSGGAMATIVMTVYNDIIASGAPVAGIAYDETTASYAPFGGVYRDPKDTAASSEAEWKRSGIIPRKQPIMVMHSEADETVLIQAAYNNRDTYGLLFDVDTSSHDWENTGSDDGYNWRHRKYRAPDSPYPSDIETHFILKTGLHFPHAWPGGADSGEWCKSVGPDWANISWTFFADHPRNPDTNQPPTVSITEAAVSGTTVTVKGTYADSDGTVETITVRLGAHAGSVHPGAASGSYAVEVTVADNAVYVPEVTATDNSGKSVQVTGDPVVVGSPVNAAPEITDIAHTEDLTCTLITARVRDPDGTIDRIDVNVDDQAWQPAGMEPGQDEVFLSFEKCGLTSGAHSFRIRAFDDAGAGTTTGPIAFDIVPYASSATDTITGHLVAGRIRYYGDGVGFGSFDRTYADLLNEHGIWTPFTLYEIDGRWWSSLPGLDLDIEQGLSVGCGDGCAQDPGFVCKTATINDHVLAARAYWSIWSLQYLAVGSDDPLGLFPATTVSLQEYDDNAYAWVETCP